MRKSTSQIAAVCLFCLLGSSAYASLLQDHFGVTLTLGAGQYDSYQDATTYPFSIGSFTPTKHTDSTNYVVGDWYGHWSKTSMNKYQTISGQYVSGEEPYDVEAMYFDDDGQNLYVAIVGSVDPPAGRRETRLNSTLVVTGDLALDFGLNAPAADGFRYDYGVNINHETRPTSGNVTTALNVLGDEVYRTANRDWYVGTPNNSPSSNRPTNFDPNYRGFGGAYLGDVLVDCYEYQFEGGKLENGYATYILEVTIPRAMVGNPEPNQMVGISWLPGCRNDVLTMSGSVDVPEPTTVSLLVIGLVGLLRRKR